MIVVKSTQTLRLALVVMVFGFLCVEAEDWPQWGGAPARNMYSPAKNLPDHFTTDKSGTIKFKAGTEDVDRTNLPGLKWVAKLGSQSYGNVTVSKGKNRLNFCSRECLQSHMRVTA